MRESHQLVAGRVGDRLKALRGQQTQAEFAAELGLSQAQYNRYETGKRLPPDRILLQVAQIKGLEPEAVIWGQDAATAPAGPQASLAQDIAALVSLLDDQGREDLFFFLKQKTEDLTRRRRREAQEARRALEGIRRLAR